MLFFQRCSSLKLSLIWNIFLICSNKNFIIGKYIISSAFLLRHKYVSKLMLIPASECRLENKHFCRHLKSFSVTINFYFWYSGLAISNKSLKWRFCNRTSKTSFIFQSPFIFIYKIPEDVLMNSVQRYPQFYWTIKSLHRKNLILIFACFKIACLENFKVVAYIFYVAE